MKSGMHYDLNALMAVGITAFVLGCGEMPTLPEAEGDQTRIATTEFVREEAPPAPLAVLRYEAGDCPGPDTRGTGFLCESKDELARYFVGHYQADDIFFCGGSSFFPRWSVQEKATAAGTHYQSTLNDAPIFIYDWDALIAAAVGGNLCGHVINNWVYMGSHDMVFNEVVRPDATFEARWSGEGFVYDQDGTRYRYSEHQVETEEGFSRQVVSVK